MLVLVPIPASATEPSCEGGAFARVATLGVGCDVPNCTPAFGKVYEANGASHTPAPDAVADGNDPGGLPVRLPAPIFRFWTTIPANGSAGSFPVVPVAGDLDYYPGAPLF